MRKLLVILLLFFPVHGASFEDPFEQKIDPVTFGENNDFSRQWIKNEIKKTITLKVHNSSDKILVIEDVHFMRNSCDESTTITYSRYKEVSPGMQGSITVNNPVGFEKIDCYGLAWGEKDVPNPLVEMLKERKKKNSSS